MLTFLMGIDLPGLIVLVVILSIIGTGIFYAIRPLIRKAFSGWSASAIATMSRVIAFILSPALLALVVYIIIYDDLHPDPLRLEQEHYAMLEEELNRELKIGMPKAEALDFFWHTDTTHSSYEFDLSPSEAKEKYLLEVKFEGGKLKSFERVK